MSYESAPTLPNGKEWWEDLDPALRNDEDLPGGMCDVCAAQFDEVGDPVELPSGLYKCPKCGAEILPF
jgi:hypothetical protein